MYFKKNSIDLNTGLIKAINQFINTDTCSVGEKLICYECLLNLERDPTLIKKHIIPLFNKFINTGDKQFDNDNLEKLNNYKSSIDHRIRDIKSTAIIPKNEHLKLKSIDQKILDQIDILHQISKYNDEIDFQSLIPFTEEDIKLFEEFKKLDFIGYSHQMRDVFKEIKKFAKNNGHVLITGPSGAGKERVAKAIHKLNGKQGEMVTVNCGALPENTIVSELFGHKKGAYTGASDDRKGYFETAGNGTIFLDEIGELPIKLQPMLLRVLEKGDFMMMGDSKKIESNARVVAATNRKLENMVKEGEFRKDLFYRLNGLRINLPSLNEHKDDIPFIAEYLCKKEIKKHSDLSWDYCKPKFHWSSKLFDILETWNWGGNVRELKSHIMRVVASIENIKEISRENFLNKLADPNITLTKSMGGSRDAAGIFRNDSSNRPYWEAFRIYIENDYNKKKTGLALKRERFKKTSDLDAAKNWIHSAFLQIAKYVEYEIDNIPNLVYETYGFKIDDVEKFVEETNKIFDAIANSYYSKKKRYLVADADDGLIDYLFEKRPHLKKE